MTELVHVHGGEPGLRRTRRGKGFAYLDASGAPVTDPDTIARIEALRIPPAWTDVWISPRPDTHLQATGLDSKGRRQYLYHPEWRRRRDEVKFDDMLDFAAALPQLRRTAHEQLGADGVSRERALALAIRLLDVGLFRVGWDRYARDNGHVGLTTLRREQVRLLDDAAQFDYIAKQGKRRRMTVRDPETVVAIAPLCRRRGEPLELLAHRGAGGWHRVTASDVNNALRCWAQGPYSAKEFRTWAATVLAAVALAREQASGRPGGRRTVNRAVREVSVALGNTPAVARASYIDPRVITSYEQGTVIDLPAGTPDAPMPLRIESGGDGVVIELPTDVPGDALREDVEHRVRTLLTA
ncbi:MAG TPA: DNA topoisomerase IB [Baekduia sp.]|uniref:DNA topoisomerase IB n=1 Tax=Baekduia sp. TaxID=2600305 RepID=UPI002CA692B9|nr:DNA topoisomerase IB [Baekduia sp.]HMJ36527.1 DNA topoisomerase IB [Baekduia sp.]